MNRVIEHIENNPQDTKRLIGLTFEQLKSLIEAAKKLENQKRQEIASAKKRIIEVGGGRPPKLSKEEQIILTLVYLHHLPTFQMLGIQFGVSESAANYIFHYWIEIFRELLPASLLEQVKKSENEEEWVKEILSELELIVDSCEQPRERPEAYQEQKKYYSGKKKNHTFKNQYQELSPEVKADNRRKSQERIFVEHLIRCLKIFRVASERFRLNAQNYGKVILAVCGLVRLRIEAIILS